MVDTYHRLTPRYSIQDNNRHHSISPFLISADINESCGMACAPPPPTMLHITPIVLNIVLHHTIAIILVSVLHFLFFFGFCVLFSVSRFASYYIHCAQYCEVPSHNHCRPSPNFYAVSVCCYVLCRPLCAYHPPLKCFRSFYGVLICCMPLCGYAPTQRRHLSVTHKRLCSFHPKQARKSGS